MTIELRRLEHSEINLLRELRNASADAFFDPTYITREMQEDWWYCYEHQPVPALQFYTIWLNKVTPVGFLSMKRLRYFEIGYLKMAAVKEVGNLLLAPAHRGRGIMQQALVELRKLHDPLTFWIAHVKEGNEASLALFERSRFWNTTNERKSDARPLPDLHRRPQPQHRARPHLPRTRRLDPREAP